MPEIIEGSILIMSKAGGCVSMFAIGEKHLIIFFSLES